MYRPIISGPYSKRYSNTAVTDSPTGNNTGKVDYNEPNPGQTYTLAVSVSPSGGGTVEKTLVTDAASHASQSTHNAGGLAYSLGSNNEGYPVYKLLARTNQGYRFTGWAGLPSGYNSTGNPIRVKIDRNLSVQAVFERIPCTVKINWNDSLGRVTCPGLTDGTVAVPYGSSITLNAIPNTDAEFVRWEGGTAQGKTSRTITITVTGNLNITAVFASADHPSGGGENPNDEPGNGGQGGGETPGGGSNGGNGGSTSGADTFDQVKSFLKKWWWLLAIAAYVIYKEKKGGSK